ncbi:hypothetical protein BS47DRAFT_1368269 [Hydnum rufescens UP504]|uniref:Uncharacterized protein n=1 Tax=Hydnum rufescens UP504 TaxID=1448309 RepID=A0A9P6AG86_9AGAM|nr:hypothetical protein BS47DRAFT_1368269 [Hydnum rufescens UP504]
MNRAGQFGFSITYLLSHITRGTCLALGLLLVNIVQQQQSSPAPYQAPCHESKVRESQSPIPHISCMAQGIRVLPGIDLQGHGTSAWSVIYQRISIRDSEAVTSQGLSSHVRNMVLLPASSDKELVLERPSKSQAPLESSAGDSSCLLVMSNPPHPQPGTLWEMCQQGDVEYLNLCVYYLRWWFKSLGVRVDSVFATAFVGSGLCIGTRKILI